MDKKDLKILFMGTPEFAVDSLRALLDGGYNVVGVVTMPDKPAGRGHKMQFSAVKQYALEQGLLVFQPEKLKSSEFLQQLNILNVDLQIVVAFRMLPEVVWNMPKFGTFNLHASLLPDYRGAAPINWAIINGEKETGVTTFFLTYEIDTGAVIFQEKIPILEEDNAGSIHDKLMRIGANLVTKTVDGIISNDIHPVPQSNLIDNTKEPKLAPKIFKETCKIDWSKDAWSIFNFIRGLSPYPTAWTEFIHPEDGIIPVKVIDSQVILMKHDLPVGTIKTDEKTFVDISVCNGFIRLKNIQLPSKKRMNIADLLRGYKITEEFKVNFDFGK